MVLINITANAQAICGMRNADRGYTVFSYGTPVLSMDCSGMKPKLVKHWDGYSVTTMRHINKFLESREWKKLTKKEWEKMEVVPY